MSLPDISGLDFTGNQEPGNQEPGNQEPEDNIVSSPIGARETAESDDLISKINGFSVQDINKEQNLVSHIEQRRQLNDRLESDPEFREAYMREQAKISKQAEQQAKLKLDSMELINDEMLLANDETPVKFPELDQLAVGQTNKPAKHIINISNVHTLTLNFY